MVKGTTRQVVVVKGMDRALFDQAIFLVKDDALLKGSVTEEALLKQAKDASQPMALRSHTLQKILCGLIGAAAVACIWCVTGILL